MAMAYVYKFHIPKLQCFIYEESTNDRFFARIKSADIDHTRYVLCLFVKIHLS